MLTWLTNPAAPTAIATEPLPSPPETPPSKAYETLSDVEDRIREELLLKRQNLQGEAEIIDQDLAPYQHANAILKGVIVGCSVAICPAHVSLSREL